MNTETIAQIAIATGTIINVLIFLWSVCLTKKSNEIAKDMLELSKSIDKQNTIQQAKANKAYWALIFTSILTESVVEKRQDKLGFILNVFGWENIQKDANINSDDLIKAISTNKNHKTLHEILSSNSKENP